MRVDNEILQASRDQVVERKRNQWFVENRHERLRQVISQRPQTHAETGAEDKGLAYSCVHLVAAAVSGGSGKFGILPPETAAATTLIASGKACSCRSR